MQIPVMLLIVTNAELAIKDTRHKFLWNNLEVDEVHVHMYHVYSQ